MKYLSDWLRTHKFQANLAAFLMMTLSPIPMYFAAQNGATGWIWILLSVVVLANLLTLSVK